LHAIANNDAWANETEDVDEDKIR
jgi:hypothetical protein